VPLVIPVLFVLGAMVQRMILSRLRAEPTMQIFATFGLLLRLQNVVLAVTGGAGTRLGESAATTETRRPATATAVAPSTGLRIPRSLFLKMLDSFPESAQKLRDAMSAHAQQSLRDIHNVRGMLDAQERK